VPKPGSGIERGWCQNCAGPVCSRACAKCVPVEQYLSNLEKGMPEDFRPVTVAVPEISTG
jgi:predicted RNA-binding protein with PUA domain